MNLKLFVVKMSVHLVASTAMDTKQSEQTDSTQTQPDSQQDAQQKSQQPTSVCFSSFAAP